MRNMKANWDILGCVGAVVQLSGSLWKVDVACNSYSSGKKVDEDWYYLFCRFKPRVSVGNVILAHGHFEKSKNPAFQYALMVEHIGTIASAQTDEGDLVEGNASNALISMLNGMNAEGRQALLQWVDAQQDQPGMEGLQEGAAAWRAAHPGGVG